MFKKCNCSDYISVEDILDKFTEFDILSYYFNITSLPTLINSPLREDKKASFGIYFSTNGHIMYRDFANGQSGNIFNLLMNIWGFDYVSTLRKIHKDIYAPSCNKISIRRINKRNVLKSNSELNVKVRDWLNHDLEFWQSYGISKEWLEFGNIYPISNIIFTSEGKNKVIPADKYAYVYVEYKDDIPTIKIYQPYSKSYKWMSKHDSSVIDLWRQLPERGDKLVITSSRKDALCIWANTGVPSIALQGEGYWPKEKIINILKNRFAKIFVLYDNDFSSEENHGQLFAEKLCGYYNGLINAFIPTVFQAKDPSDLYKKHGKEVFLDVINKLLNQ